VKDLARPAASLLPEILALREAGRNFSEIGRELGLSRQAVRRALAGQRKPARI
jgi:predicted transcriptional regulator